MRDRKRERLALDIAIRDRLAPLFCDPAVEAWFGATDAHMVAAILAAKSDEERREAAALARAFRDLRSFVTGRIDAGERARRDLEGM